MSVTFHEMLQSFRYCYCLVTVNICSYLEECLIDFVIAKHSYYLMWIVRCTVWNISHINNFVIGIEQSETFSIGSLIFPHIHNHNARCVSTCVKHDHFCYFRDRYLVFAVTNLEIFSNQIEIFTKVSVEYIFIRDLINCAY